MTDIEKKCHDLAIAFVSCKLAKEDNSDLKESEFLDLYASAYEVFSDEIRSVVDDADSSDSTI